MWGCLWYLICESHYKPEVPITPGTSESSLSWLFWSHKQTSLWPFYGRSSEPSLTAEINICITLHGIQEHPDHLAIKENELHFLLRFFFINRFEVPPFRVIDCSVLFTVGFLSGSKLIYFLFETFQRIASSLNRGKYVLWRKSNPSMNA